MKKLVLVLLLVVIGKLSFSQRIMATIKKTALHLNEFVPAGWKLIAEAKGDLNKDGLDDGVLVIENTDLKHIISNVGNLGGDTLNTNPRWLLIVFKKKTRGYELFTTNKTFIPAANSEASPCLLDPFGENGSITITKGLLNIHFHHFYSCGAWEIYNFDYIFRYQKQKLELIGYNKSSLHRSSGEETSTTVNFSTLKMNYTSGSNAFKEGAKPKTVWKKIKPMQLFELNTISQESVQSFIN